MPNQKKLFAILVLLFLWVPVSSCGPGTFFGTWSDIATGEDNASYSPPRRNTREQSFPNEPSRIKQIQRAKFIQIYGIPNREGGFLLAGDDAEIGFSVTSGDINGDQIDDIIIGAPDSEGILPNTTRSGWVYVILGKPDLPRKIDLKRNVDIGFWGGEDAGRNLLGHSLISSDLNGDGVSDLIMGAPFGSGRPESKIHSGVVHVFFGRKSLRGIHDLSKEADVTFLGAREGDLAGFSLAAGDLNGDKLSDLIIGAPGGDGYADKESGSGETYVIYGRRKFPRIVDLARHWNSRVFGVQGTGFSGPFKENGPDKSGYAVSASDLNGDGLDDLVIGAPFADGFLDKNEDAGETYVIFGRKKFPKNIHLSKRADITLYGKKRQDRSGEALVKGDLNGDGIDDLIISSPNAKRNMKNGPLVGLLHAVYGKRNHPQEYHLNTDASVFFKSNYIGQCDVQDLAAVGKDPLSFGRSIAALDLNGNGRDDLVVGVPCAEGRKRKTRSGELSFFFSKGQQRLVAPTAVFQPPTAKLDELFGFSLSQGDVNGDGSKDILVGAPGMPRNKSLYASGGVYILLGQANHRDIKASKEP